jgi:hypothetical protein
MYQTGPITRLSRDITEEVHQLLEVRQLAHGLARLNVAHARLSDVDGPPGLDLTRVEAMPLTK